MMFVLLPPGVCGRMVRARLKVVLIADSHFTKFGSPAEPGRGHFAEKLSHSLFSSGMLVPAATAACSMDCGPSSSWIRGTPNRARRTAAGVRAKRKVSGRFSMAAGVRGETPLRMPTARRRDQFDAKIFGGAPIATWQPLHSPESANDNTAAIKRLNRQTNIGRPLPPYRFIPRGVVGVTAPARAGFNQMRVL